MFFSAIFWLFFQHSIVACCLVNKNLLKYASRLVADITNISAKQKQQRELLESLFATGVCIFFLEWYEKHLRYPVYSDCEGVEQQAWLAAKGGHLHLLEYIAKRAAAADWKAMASNSMICSGAAFGGHLEVLKWARANGCERDAEICYFAASGGHLEVLKWARANGCQWDAYTCACAAGGGHLEVLKWARANGCQWDARTCLYAAVKGHQELFEWAKANGCPSS